MASTEGAARAFRRDLYATFPPGATPSSSSLTPCCARPARSLRCPSSRSSRSSDEATAVSTRSLAEGAIDEDRAALAPCREPPSELASVFAVDASTVGGCDAETSPGRGFYYSASTHSAGQPIVAGWPYQWICQLSWAPDSWTAPLDVCRVPPARTRPPPRSNRSVASSASCQKTARCRCSCSTPAMTRSASVTTPPTARCEVLCRIRDDRVFYTDAPPRPNRPPGSGGRPPRHGSGGSAPTLRPGRRRAGPRRLRSPLRHSPSLPGTACIRACPDGVTGRGYQAPPIVKGSVIRVEVEHLPRPTSAQRRRCGCGGRARASPISTGAGVPTYADLILSTGSGS